MLFGQPQAQPLGQPQAPQQNLFGQQQPQQQQTVLQGQISFGPQAQGPLIQNQGQNQGQQQPLFGQGANPLLPQQQQQIGQQQPQQQQIGQQPQQQQQQQINQNQPQQQQGQVQGIVQQQANQKYLNMTFDELFKTWSQEIEHQFISYQKFGEKSNSFEKELYEMESMLAGIRAIMEQVEKDNTSVNKSIQGIEDQQNDLMSQLTDIEAWLKTQEFKTDSTMKSEGIMPGFPSGYDEKEFTDLVGKAYSVYKQSLMLESNVEILTKQLNQDEDGLSYPITKIFNEYYSTLEMIQEQTGKVHQELFELENSLQNQKMVVRL